MTEPDYKKVPLLNQIKYLAGLIDSQGELKMTSKGFLPVKVVADIYQQGFLKRSGQNLTGLITMATDKIISDRWVSDFTKYRRMLFPKISQTTVEV